MATFVLVHGAWHGGWCWQRAAPLLRAAGHEVVTPTLTGLGERSHLAYPTIDLSTHVQDLIATLEYDDLRDVILVGHSYGAVVITATAEQAADRIAQLVLLDGPIADDGQAVRDLLGPGAWADFQARAAREGDGWRIPPNSPAALGITDEVDAHWVAARLTPQPIKTFEQPVHLASAAARALARAYIFCAPPRPGSILNQFAARARAAGWRYHELTTGHDAMVTQPRELAAALLAGA
jgi:pimeloyl-ACP methyl ester carboxylesterase